MRIGVDLLGVQSPQSRGRGIGRYSRCLLSALAALGESHELVLYAHAGLPDDALEGPLKASVRVVPMAKEVRAAAAIERVLRDDPDRLDVLLVLSPFELHGDYCPPERPLESKPRLAAVVYDLIPWLFQERYLTYEPIARRFYRNLERLRRYDTLLAISEATRQDTVRLLGVSADRVAVLGGAADTEFFRPAPSEPIESEVALRLRRYGIDRPFVFCLASTDLRKNVSGLFDAFALLPVELREAHQLVVACALTGPEADELRRWGVERGIAEHLVLTGEVSDEVLCTCYQRCAAFAFPSLYEGFGLPILEAMSCGAAVIAGKNSSQVEVAGEAAVLVNAHDAADIAANLQAVLTDAPRREWLRSAGRAHALGFSWEQVGSRALEALGSRSRKPSVSRPRPSAAERPPLAFLSPLPVRDSGVADYAMRLLPELSRHYAIDLYREAGFEPDLGRYGAFASSPGLAEFPRRDRVKGYRQILSQVGNSHFHGFLYDLVLERGGVVTLHDLFLTGFHWWRAHQGLDGPVDRGRLLAYIEAEIVASEPERWPELVPLLPGWIEDPEELKRQLVRHDVPMNRRVVEAADAVIVHSRWARDRLAARHPELASRFHVVPHGADAVQPDPRRRAETRASYGLDCGGFLIGSFGILHPQKMNVEGLEAFARIAARWPDATFVFAGPDFGAGEARRAVVSLGLEPRVRFLGRLPDAAFLDLVAAVDIGLCLRRPPTNGETSGALLHLLRHGIPTIVTEADAFAEYPAPAVATVATGPGLIEGLARAMDELLSLPDLRRLASEAALTHVRNQHAWSLVAARYAEVITASEPARERRRRARGVA